MDTVGKIMIRRALPEELRQEVGDKPLDKREIDRILTLVAEKYPGEYRKVSKALLDLGVIATNDLNTSFSLDDLRSPVDKDKVFAAARKKEADILRDRSLSREEKNQRILELYQGPAQSLASEVYDRSLEKGSNLARMVQSGARGNKSQLNSNIGADVLVADMKGRSVPLPIFSSYSEGLDPAEYFAASYGTRLGLVATKTCCSGDTEVRMADGTTKKIKDIEPGEWVVGSDSKGVAIPVRVIRRFDNGPRECRRHSFRVHSSKTLVTFEATDDHKILSWIADEDVWQNRVGLARESSEFTCILCGNSSTAKWEKSEDLGMIDTYDLEVDHPDHLFVLANGLIVSNSVQDGGYLCLSEDTMVRMGDYSSKPIKDIVPGDIVLGANADGKTFPVSVVNKFDNGEREVWSFKFRLGRSRKTPLVELKSTRDHKVRGRVFKKVRAADPEVRPIKDFAHEGAGVALADADTICNFVSQELIGNLRTYDIEVDHPDHLFVLENGMVVSNSKQLASAASDLIVTTDDCGTNAGMTVPASDRANPGAVLAKDAGGYKRGTILTPKIMADIDARTKGGEVMVRSAATCSAPNGVCSKCAGVRERGHLPKISDNIGLAAASGASEPISQGLLCLAKGTMVRMANGEERPIEDISPGDVVIGSDKEGNLRPVSVVNRYDNGPKEVWRVGFRVGAKSKVFLESTLEHKILMSWAKTGCKGEEMNSVPQVLPVGEEANGFVAYRLDGKEVSRCPRDKQREFLGIMPTYDLEVDHPDHLFVLANGLIVSNSTKHSAGVTSGGGSSKVTGFPAVNALAQIPEEFPDAAIISEVDGRVEEIRELPQGGFAVKVGGEEHVVPSSREVTVKRGDEVEAGDVLSSGVPNPADIVRHKGIGEGRRYFVEAMTKAVGDMGTSVDRRNLEVLARAVINHVNVDSDDVSTGYLPDDVVEFSEFARTYVPSSGTKKLPLSKVVPGKHYLERPEAHYTIGTRMTKRALDHLKKAGVKEISVSEDKPSFSPVMVRVMDNPAYKDDWMTHLSNSYVQRNITSDLEKGKAESFLHGPNYIPSLAKGIEFGRPPAGQPGY